MFGGPGESSRRSTVDALIFYVSTPHLKMLYNLSICGIYQQCSLQPTKRLGEGISIW